MPSRTKRRELRQKRRSKAGNTEQAVDRHAALIMQHIGSAASLLEQAPSGDAALPWLESDLEDAVTSLASSLGRYGRFSVCEVARMNFLPWSFMGRANFPDTEGGPARVELLTLLAASSDASRDTDASQIWHQLGSWKHKVDRIIQLSALVHLHRASSSGTIDPMAKIQASTRASEVLVRNLSYPDMVETTLSGLFDEPSVRSTLISLFGFDLKAAVSVLNACDLLQADNMSERVNNMLLTIQEGVSNQDNLTESDFNRIRDEVEKSWDPSDEDVSVSVEEVAAESGTSVAVAQAVLEKFTLNASDLGSSQDVAEGFTSGDNPLRTHPLVSNGNDRFMLVHPALVLPAIRENFEQALKASPFWNAYQTHRGKYLETEVAISLSLTFPGAKTLAGFEYFVPANEDEEDGDPSGYTKLVEGDLFTLLDDVAIVTEAKAVAVAPTARAGHTRRLRSDLVRIITEAAEQADRLKIRIERDGGLRLRDNTWLDASRVREIHTIAVSLEDLSGVSTANADLVRAGLLSADSIPWTVSLNDLRLVTELVDESAVAIFLLYLRRRRHPQVTLKYAAADELDFFLHFFENGLYVQPDPELMRDSLEWVTEVRTGPRRRWEQSLAREFISSRTDPLDAWHSFQIGDSQTRADKPRLKGSPALPLVRELQERRDFGWCSAGATFLSGSTGTQNAFMTTPRQLIRQFRADGQGHSTTRPYGSSREDAWVLVWAVEDTTADLTFLRDYVRAKKYQLKVPRAVALVYDGKSGGLHSVLYDGSPNTADARLDALCERLYPPDKWQRSLPPPQRSQKRRK